MYEWLHNWAGLYLDVEKTLVNDSLPVYKIDTQVDKVSTKSLIFKVWQRLVSKSMLNLQINHFIDKNDFSPEVNSVLKDIKEF